MSNVKMYSQMRAGHLPKMLEQLHRDIPMQIVFKRWADQDDFVETGMRALLTGVSTDSHGFITLYFYFGDHYDHNKKLFRKVFYKTDGELVTAEEAGKYFEYYSIDLEPEQKLSELLSFTHNYRYDEGNDIYYTS